MTDPANTRDEFERAIYATHQLSCMARISEDIVNSAMFSELAYPKPATGYLVVTVEDRELLAFAISDVERRCRELAATVDKLFHDLASAKAI